MPLAESLGMTRKVQGEMPVSVGRRRGRRDGGEVAVVHVRGGDHRAGVHVSDDGDDRGLSTKRCATALARTPLPESSAKTISEAARRTTRGWR